MSTMRPWFHVIACLLALCATVLTGPAGSAWASPPGGSALLAPADAATLAVTLQDDQTVPPPASEPPTVLAESAPDVAPDSQELLGLDLPGPPPRRAQEAPVEPHRPIPASPDLARPQRPPRA